MQTNEEENVGQLKQAKQIVKQIHQQIVQKICHTIVYSNEDFKIFADVLQTKDDIQRLIRERKFMVSLHSNTVSYEQPKISPKKSSNSPLKFNNKQQQQQLSVKAKNFIIQIQRKKKILEGKTHILKRTQLLKKRDSQHKKNIEYQVEKEVQKNIRRIKAEKNVQFFNQKKSTQQRFSRPNSPTKRKISSLSNYQQSEKSIKLPSIYTSIQLQEIKEQEQNIPIGLKKTVRKKNSKRVHSQQISRSYTPSSSFSVEVKLFQQNKVKDKLNSVRTNKTLRQHYKTPEESQRVRYLMKKQRGNQIKQYLQNFSNINQLVQNKTSINDYKSNMKNIIKQRHFNKQSVRSSISFVDMENTDQFIQQQENQLQ